MSKPDSALRHPDDAKHAEMVEPSCRVSHVADWNRRHPGETVTLYTRVEVSNDEVTRPALTLEIDLPPELILDDYRAVCPEHALPQITTSNGAHHLIWTIGQEPAGNDRFECQVEARVAATQHDLTLESHAVVYSRAPLAGDAHIREEWAVLGQETATITISTSSEYLRFLPALFQQDDLMGRFLMLFGSFWRPLEHQIDDLWLYFDPRLTPAEFLPWLASWLSLVLDESWPEEKQRQLIRSAIFLYRKRGTKRGLEEFLTIYSGAKPDIVEYRAYDFRLGSEARLGPGIALGKGNVAHTFTVTLRLPSIAVPLGEKEDKEVQKELARQRRQKIEAIIEAEKPAHTSYTLHLETDRQHGTRG
jgi:phage tail-like protein